MKYRISTDFAAFLLKFFFQYISKTHPDWSKSAGIPDTLLTLQYSIFSLFPYNEQVCLSLIQCGPIFTHFTQN